jgi:broad specificity phosphatase PhoE
MDGRLYCIRHAQSTFNVAEGEHRAGYSQLISDPTYIDADITEHGRFQVEAARPHVHSLQIDRVYVSPLKRALSTCKLLFQDHPASPPVIVIPEITEQLREPCSFSSNLEGPDPNFLDFDWGEFDESSSGYWMFDLIDNETTRQIRQATDKTRWPEVGCSFFPTVGKIESTSEVQRRVEKAKARFRDDMSQGLNVAIVSHWNFIRHLTTKHDGKFLDLANLEVRDISTLITTAS